MLGNDVIARKSQLQNRAYTSLVLEFFAIDTARITRPAKWIC